MTPSDLAISRTPDNMIRISGRRHFQYSMYTGNLQPCKWVCNFSDVFFKQNCLSGSLPLLVFFQLVCGKPRFALSKFTCLFAFLFWHRNNAVHIIYSIATWSSFTQVFDKGTTQKVILTSRWFLLCWRSFFESIETHSTQLYNV